ncbi:MAG: hypothetical protein RI897_3886, partial [Verrucomicrobiota bacterium]
MKLLRSTRLDGRIGLGLLVMAAFCFAGAVQGLGSGREEWMANWPMFRGPRGDGVSGVTNAPVAWDVESGAGVLWKVKVPHGGHGSPVVWGDRIFLTGGDVEERHVMCFDAAKGGLLWDREVAPPAEGFGQPLEVMEDTGVAASTPATDGQRVYAIFASGELVAYDYAGELVWSKFLGVPDSMYGYASSLVVWGDLLVVLYDQGNGRDGKSHLYAFDCASGEKRWERSRPVAASWSTPLVTEVGGKARLMVLGDPWVMGYDVLTGDELWRLDCMGTDLAPMPVVTTNLLVVVSPGNHVSGLRMDGEGDVTETHQAWQYDEFVPDITSPVSDGERVYLLITYGDVVCVDGVKGETLWEKSLEVEFNASPVLVGGNIYAFSAEGESVVFA